jgi:hypothetical protein
MIDFSDIPADHYFLQNIPAEHRPAVRDAIVKLFESLSAVPVYAEQSLASVLAFVASGTAIAAEDPTFAIAITQVACDSVSKSMRRRESVKKH